MDQTKPKTTPKDFFLHISSIVTLYVSIVSLVNLLFSTINQLFPDAVEHSYYYDPYSGPLRWSIASLVIVFPLYLVLTRLINRDIEKNPPKAELAPRKWFAYITLFLTGAAIVTDLIVLINTFLGGEITTRFILKVLALLIVTGLVFTYYILDLIKDSKTMQKTRLAWRIGAIFIVVASLVLGFVVLGSPGQARKERFDLRKINDLQNIQNQVVNYWRRKQVLPKNIEDLRDSLSNQGIPNDPQSGEEYQYIAEPPLSFKLCANFNLTSKTGLNKQKQTAPMRVDGQDNWEHQQGVVCFDRKIDPELYTPIKNNTVIEYAPPIY